MKDPLKFNMEKVVTFKMPKVTSVKMYDDIDKENPNIEFKNSKYYRQKNHLKGYLNQN